MNNRHLIKSHRTNVLTAILCVVLLISTVKMQPVFAQGNNALTLSARIGFDGFCKRNAWLPIHVDVQNTGTDIQGRIEISYKKGSDGTAITSTEIDLPSTSHKEFFLYLYFTGNSQTINIRLLDGKKVLEEINESVNCLDEESTLFGVLANEPSSYDVLGDIKPLKGVVRVAKMGISDLPDRFQAWQSLDALVISNIDTGVLTIEQKLSLQTWIAGGGKLLVVGGHNWQGTASGLKDLIPVQLHTTQQVISLTQLGDYIRVQTPLESGALLASGTLQKGATVLVYQGQIPLLVQRSLGFGVIYFLAADPALQPLRNWDGMRDLYEHIFGIKIKPPPWVDGIETNYRVNQALAAIPELGIPPSIYIWFILLLYIVIIGPLNYIVLRRMKRRELGWITIPLLVILSSGLLYGTGFFYRGVTPTLNRLVIVQAWDDVEQADVHALVGIYSPARTKYDLRAEQAFMFRPLSEFETFLQSNNKWHTVQQGQNMYIPDIRGEIGDMKSVAVQGNISALEFEHDLTITFSSKDPLLTGTITNNSQHTIRNAILATTDDWIRLNDFAPGETKNVKISLGNNSSGPSLFSTSTSTLLRTRDFENTKDVDAIRQNAFLSILLTSGDTTNQGSWGVYIIGWVDDMTLPVQLQDKKSKDLDTAVYVNKLTPSLTFQPGVIRLPSSMFVWESSQEMVSPFTDTDVPSNGYILRFRPGITIPYRTIDSLNIHIYPLNGTEDLVLSGWNYDEKSWTRLDLAGSIVHVDNPTSFVGPDGEVRIQMKYIGSNWMSVENSYITMMVEQ